MCETAFRDDVCKDVMMSARVAVLKCEDYERDRVFKTVHETLELLGGIGRYVQKGQKVLLKPNMLSAKAPKRGITTHPVLLEALIREIQTIGAEIWLDDSPSGAIKGIKRYWENTGYQDLSNRTGVKLINFEAGGTVVREIGEKKYHLARSVFEADVVINLPKFKTHGYTLYTGAIKNLYGSLPGFQKSTFHKLYSHPENFSRILVDIFSLVRCPLHLMDGILGMEGNGPATGHLRDVGLILASEDGVALDTVVSHIMGFKENEIDAIRLAGERELGENKLENIQILGAELDNVRFDDYILPSNRLVRLIPQSLVRVLGKFIWVRPKCDLLKCTGCGICGRSCPVGAIQMIDDKPVMDYDTCINCLCCNESCPEGAVIQEMSFLAKKLA